MTGPLKFCIVLETPEAKAEYVHAIDVSATEVAKNTPEQLEALVGSRVLDAIRALTS